MLFSFFPLFERGVYLLKCKDLSFLGVVELGKLNSFLVDARDTKGYLLAELAEGATAVPVAAPPSHLLLHHLRTTYRYL